MGDVQALLDLLRVEDNLGVPEHAQLVPAVHPAPRRVGDAPLAVPPAIGDDVLDQVVGVVLGPRAGRQALYAQRSEQLLAHARQCKAKIKTERELNAERFKRKRSDDRLDLACQLSPFVARAVGYGRQQRTLVERASAHLVLACLPPARAHAAARNSQMKYMQIVAGAIECAQRSWLQRVLFAGVDAQRVFRTTVEEVE